MARYDDLNHPTIEQFDFAGRAIIVQNPGGSTAPSSAAKNQPMCLYAEYDEASRVVAVYDGDGGKTVFSRDGQGRVIQRELEVPGTRISLFNTKDVLQRDALGRLQEAKVYGSTGLTGSGSPNHNTAVVFESFQFDSVGRTHEEKYRFLGSLVTNQVSVASSWSGGSPHRAGLNYADGLPTGLASLSAPVGLSFTHDGIGRLSQVDWDVAPGGSGTTSLAEYGWVGGLRHSPRNVPSSLFVRRWILSQQT